jgi:hypothetical protein
MSYYPVPTAHVAKIVIHLDSCQGLCIPDKPDPEIIDRSEFPDPLVVSKRGVSPVNSSDLPLNATASIRVMFVGFKIAEY